jgi:hypothetical protein
MKDFKELTDAEVLELTDDEVQTYINLACAEEGVPFLPPCPVAPEPYNPIKSVTIYKVVSLEFTDGKEADKLAEIINGMQSRTNTAYKYPRGGYNGSGVLVYEGVDADPITISTVQVFSKEDFEGNRSKLAVYEANKTEHDKLKKEYDRIYGQREELETEINRRLEKVRTNAQYRLNLINGFEQYLELADGNPVVAMRFYRRAVLVPEEIVEFLVPDFYAKPEAQDGKAIIADDDVDEEAD